MTLIIINLLVCTFAAYVCICRMRHMSASSTKLELRAQYAVWFVILTVSGWGFMLFDEPVNTVQLTMSIAILGHLLLGAPIWRGGLPHYWRRYT